MEDLTRVLEGVDSPTVASAAMAIQQAVTSCWAESLEDDATAVVMAVD